MRASSPDRRAISSSFVMRPSAEWGSPWPQRFPARRRSFSASGLCRQLLGSGAVDHHGAVAADATLPMAAGETCPGALSDNVLWLPSMRSARKLKGNVRRREHNWPNHNSRTFVVEAKRVETRSAFRQLGPAIQSW